MVFPYLVIPAQARILCLRFLKPREKRSFHSPYGRAGHFLLCGQEKVTKEKATPDGALFGHPALRVRDRTAGFAGCTSVCIQRTGAHPARHPAGCSFVRSPRLRGAFRRHPAAEAKARAAALPSTSSRQCRDARSHGSTAPFAVPSIAGDGGKCPQGRAQDVRASADSTRMYCQTTPPSPRSAGTPRRA